MSELKVYHHELRHNEYEEFYLKYEADKVIAELEDKLKNVSVILKETREWLMESQKLHKRCADTAWNYPHECSDTYVREGAKVRKWEDTEWHEPTVDYLGLEDK